MKRIIASILILIITACAVCGCSSGSSGKTTVNIGYFNNVTHAQALYMKAEGTLDEALGDSAEIKWTAFNAGPSEVEAIFAGNIDIGYIGPVPAITANVKSDSDVTVLSGATLAGAELIKAPESDIKTAKDLDGKTVAIPQIGNTQHLCLLKLLEDNGLKPVGEGGTVNVTAVENADVQNMMDNGTIDAAFTPEPWSSTLVENGAEIVLDYDEAYMNGDYPVAVVVVRNDFLKEHPEIVSEFLKEHERVTEYMSKNTDSCAKIVNDEINAATGKSLKESVLNQAFKKIVISTDVSDKAMKDFGDISVKYGFIKATYKDLYTDKTLLK